MNENETFRKHWRAPSVPVHHMPGPIHAQLQHGGQAINTVVLYFFCFFKSRSDSPVTVGINTSYYEPMQHKADPTQPKNLHPVNGKPFLRWNFHTPHFRATNTGRAKTGNGSKKTQIDCPCQRTKGPIAHGSSILPIPARTYKIHPKPADSEIVDVRPYCLKENLSQIATDEILKESKPRSCLKIKHIQSATKLVRWTTSPKISNRTPTKEENCSNPRESKTKIATLGVAQACQPLFSWVITGYAASVEINLVLLYFQVEYMGINLQVTFSANRV